MKKQLVMVIFGILLLFSLTLVSAVPPVTSEFVGTTGLDVQANVFEYYKVNEGAEVHIYVFNRSDGNIIGSPTVNCTVELVDANGTVVLEGYPIPFDSHFHMTRPPSAVSENGVYGLTIVCNTTLIAGYKTAFFEANPTGSELSTSQSILFSLILTLLGIFLFFSIGGVKKAESGSATVGYVCLTYVILYSMISVVYLLAINYLWQTPILESIVYIIWFGLAIGFLPFIIIISLYILGQEARAVLEQDYLEMGHTPKEARDLSKKKKR